MCRQFLFFPEIKIKSGSDDPCLFSISLFIAFQPHQGICAILVKCILGADVKIEHGRNPVPDTTSERICICTVGEVSIIFFGIYTGCCGKPSGTDPQFFGDAKFCSQTKFQEILIDLFNIDIALTVIINTFVEVAIECSCQGQPVKRFIFGSQEKNGRQIGN